MQRDLKDILAGLVFIAFGLAFAVMATSYEIGSTLRMGPGYFPFVLGGILAILGGVIAIKGFLAGEGEAIGAIPWRAVGLIIGAVLFFGLPSGVSVWFRPCSLRPSYRASRAGARAWWWGCPSRWA